MLLNRGVQEEVKAPLDVSVPAVLSNEVDAQEEETDLRRTDGIIAGMCLCVRLSLYVPEEGVFTAALKLLNGKGPHKHLQPHPLSPHMHKRTPSPL